MSKQDSKFTEAFDKIKKVKEGKEKLEVSARGEVSSLVGLTEAEAKTKVSEAGFLARVITRDGTPFVGTRDFRQDRVNLTVEKDLVTKAFVG